jgi:acylglycerol lipase
MPNIGQYTTNKGAVLKYRIWEAKDRADALVYLHGIESHSEWFSECAEKISRHGVSVYALDRRGSGLNDAERGHCRDFLQFPNDVVDFATGAATKQHQRIHLTGLSWGGKLAVAIVILFPDLFSSMTLIAPGIFPKVAPAGSEKLRIAFDMFLRPQALHPIPIQNEMFTSIPKYLTYIANDPLRLHKVTAAFYRNSLRIDRFLKKHKYQWKTPTQLLIAEHDAIINNQKLQSMFESLKIQKKRVLLYKGCNHLLQFEKPADVARDIADWIRLNQ